MEKRGKKKNRKQWEIRADASKGGKAAAQAGTLYRFTPEDRDRGREQAQANREARRAEKFEADYSRQLSETVSDVMGLRGHWFSKIAEIQDQLAMALDTARVTRKQRQEAAILCRAIRDLLNLYPAIEHRITALGCELRMKEKAI